MALCSLDHGSRRARRCGASTPGIEPFYPQVGHLCWVWERRVSRCPVFLASSKPSSLPASGVKRSLILWRRFSLVLPAALQTFLVCMGTTALPRASAAPQAPGACGRSWGCWLFSRVPVQLWPFFAVWAGHCVPGETVLDPRVLGSVPPCPHPVTFRSKRRCGAGGPWAKLSPPCAMPTSVWLF